MKRIFVIRQGTKSSAGKNVQQILIFDDHPDSLRLVFGVPANPRVDHPVPRRTTPWVVFFSMLALGLWIANVMAALLTSPLVNENHFGLLCNDDALWPCLKSISPRQSGAGTADACTAFLLLTRKRQ